MTKSLPVSGFMSNPPTGPNFVRCLSPEGDVLSLGAAGEAPNLDSRGSSNGGHVSAVGPQAQPQAQPELTIR